MLDIRNTAPGKTPATHRRRLPAVTTLRRLAELLALTAFAIAQPILDVTGRAPDFFLYRHANTNEMRLFLVLVTLVPPLVLWGIELLVERVSKVAARALHLTFAAVLFAMILVQIGKKAGPFGGVPLAFLAVVAGGALAVLLVRKRGFRQAVTYAAPAPLIFALLFTVTSPSGALVLGTGAPGAAGRAVPNRPPIVFLFLDEFPLRALLDDNGRIDGNLFPNFARLQQMSNWYPNATGVTGYTPYAAPAMLRGTFPTAPHAGSYINYPETLYTLLARSYRMHAYETITDLCPPGMCVDVASDREVGMRALAKDTWGLAGELVSPYEPEKNVTEQFVENAIDVAKEAAEGKEKPSSRKLFGRLALNQPQRFGPYVEGLIPRPEPTLHLMHLLLPHAPYRYLPSGMQYQGVPRGFPQNRDPELPVRGFTPDEPLWSVLQKQRLVLQTMYTDRLIGAMLNRMQDTGLLDQALLIVTADHGTGLDPRHEFRTLGIDRNPADIAWVPMFVKTPGQKQGKVDRRNAMTVDLFPTITDVLDVTVPWAVDGVSLLGPARKTTEKFWTDNPGGKGKRYDQAAWEAKVAKGYASELADPELGAAGMFKVGPLGHHVGKKVTDFTLGTPSPIVAKVHKNVNMETVDPDTGVLPALLFGDLDRPAGPDSTWLLAAVNGTIAGAVAAMPTNGEWKFAGMLDESLFTEQRAPIDKSQIQLFAVDGRTLHRLALVR